MAFYSLERITDETIEIMCHKWHKLPLQTHAGDFDYHSKNIKEEVTDNPLDIAEVSMDLEDAFDITFDNALPGDKGLETISEVIAFINEQANA